MGNSKWDEFGLYHLNGKVWGTQLIEIESLNGKRRWEAIPVYVVSESGKMVTPKIVDTLDYRPPL